MTAAPSSAVVDEMDVLFGRGQITHQVSVTGNDALGTSFALLGLVRLFGGHLVQSVLTTEAARFKMSLELAGLSCAGARTLVCDMAALPNVTLAHLDRHVIYPTDHAWLKS